MQNIFGAELRRVENRDHLGKPALVVIAARSFDTSLEDLWNAVTTADRIARWLSPIEGELKLGGRYQIKGNAGGSITRCDPPEAFDVTWEFGGGVSWVNVRLAKQGRKARLTLEHIAHRDGIGAEHLKQFGPGAVGIGWDLSFEGLKRHIETPGQEVGHENAEAWMRSSEGKTFVRTSGDAWGAAHIESGEDPTEARAKVERTIQAYTPG